MPSIPLLALFLATFLTSSAHPVPQSTQNQQASPNRPHVDQSVVVGAHLTPEEAEDGKINDLAQPLYPQINNGDCDLAIQTAQSVVIPAAEKAKFESVRKKYLFFSYSSMGNCFFKMKRYAEAEQNYLKAVDDADKDDSSYAENYRSIGLARMAQGNLKDAEEPLRMSIPLLGAEVNRFKTSDNYKEDDIVANDVRMSQDLSLNYLAVLCFRQQRYAEALSLLDQAYSQATTFHAPSQVVKQIVENGQAAALVSGDEATMSTWAKRTLPSN